MFLHGTGPDGNSHDGEGAFMAAIECNVFEGATGDHLLIRGDDAEGRLLTPRLTVNVGELRDVDCWPWWDPEGEPLSVERWGRINWRLKDAGWKDVTGFRGKHDVERPVGEWNQLEITCYEETIEVRLNGTMVNRATGVWPNHGQILIQCEGSEYFIRRLKMRPLVPHLQLPRRPKALLPPRGWPLERV